MIYKKANVQKRRGSIESHEVLAGFNKGRCIVMFKKKEPKLTPDHIMAIQSSHQYYW